VVRSLIANQLSIGSIPIGASILEEIVNKYEKAYCKLIRAGQTEEERDREFHESISRIMRGKLEERHWRIREIYEDRRNDR
jgi:hypothetical protein